MIQQSVLSTILSALIVNLFVIPVLSSIQENVPVCPGKLINEREQNYPYVVYGNDPALCYVASRQGPCPRGSVLFAKPRSHLGICSCECFLTEGIVFDESVVANYRYCFNSVDGSTYAYDKRRAQCYRLGSQGPCSTGEIFKDSDILDYDYSPKCVREEFSNEPHTKCPHGTIYSTLLNACTDMSFQGLSRENGSSSSNNNNENANKPCNNSTTSSPPTTTGRCPPGTIYSTLLNICTDMNFKGLNGSSSNNSSNSSSSATGKCPPGTIYSTLLNICTDMNFKGLNSSSSSSSSPPASSGGRCPPGTIYSTLLNICTDMNFRGLSNSSTNAPAETGKCPPGTIYSTLLNICTDMNFRGLSSTSKPQQQGKCPEGTIYSTLLNRCTDMNFRGLGWGTNKL